MLRKCCTQYASKFGTLSSGHRTGKGQFSFQSQRKAMPKNAQKWSEVKLLSRVQLFATPWTAAHQASLFITNSWSLFHRVGDHSERSTFTASSFKIWNSSTGIPSPPLALFIVMLPKAHLTSHSRMSGSRWVITPLWLSGSWRSFVYSSCVFLPPLLNIFCFC